MFLKNYPAFKKALYLIILFPAMWMVGLFIFIQNIPEKPADLSQPVDAVVVLTGGRMRVEEGIRIFLSIKAKKLLISGVPEGVTVKDILKNIEDVDLISRINSDDIILGKLAHTTISNSMETKIFMKLHDFKSMALVTSNYHIVRSKKIFASDMPDIQIYPCPVVPEKFRKSGSFITWPSMQLAIIEYNKLLFFYVLELDHMADDFIIWYKDIWQSFALRFLNF